MTDFILLNPRGFGPRKNIMQNIHPLPTLEWVLSAQAEKKTADAISPIAAWRQLRAPLLVAIDVAAAAVNESIDASIDVYNEAVASKKAAIAADKEFCRNYPCPGQTQWRHFSPHDPLVIAIFGGSK